VSEMRIVCDYPYPVITVWRALTGPAVIPLWTSTGQAGRPRVSRPRSAPSSDSLAGPSLALEEIPGGTRLIWEHTGFHGVEGAFMSRLLGRVRRKMLSQGLPAVLADIGDDGRLRPGSTLRAKP
jgi:hypothetical protein